MPIICFTYHGVSHIVARCPEKKKEEMTNMKTSKKEERMMTTRAIRIKVRNLAILLKKKVIVSLACLMK